MYKVLVWCPSGCSLVLIMSRSGLVLSRMQHCFHCTIWMWDSNTIFVWLVNIFVWQPLLSTYADVSMSVSVDLWPVICALLVVFFRGRRKNKLVCFLKSSHPLLTQASWSSAASCCSSVDSGCWAPLSGYTDPPTSSRKDIRLQHTCRDQFLKEEMKVHPGKRPALQSLKTGGLTATPREGWLSPESCARPGTVASFLRRPIPPRPLGRQQAQLSPGVSTPQTSPPIHWCR